MSARRRPVAARTFNAAGWTALLVAAVASLSACTRPSKLETPKPAGDDQQTWSRPFLAPLELTDDPLQDAIVRVVGSVSCSGTLIADDLVLTAHHCVTQRGPKGAILPRDEDASSVRVELGGDDLPWGEVGVKAIVTPACGYEQGGGDIAILVLSRKLVGIPTFVPRLSGDPQVGEEVTPWGFGRCAMNDGPIHRRSRAGGAVTDFDSGVFRADAAICPGDSGGPALNSRREVVGVVSAAVMDTDARTKDPAYFARLDKFEHLFSAAREIADGASPTELPPYKSCESL
ncbi:MAG: S1 family peptidase [Polyangiaceae bacterium]|nr:S1 family peptidase [Polyangiaceae bacterium]